MHNTDRVLCRILREIAAERGYGLAARAAEALSLRFVSVDVVDVAGEFRVLEVNSGVMLEGFARLVPAGYDRAKEIYRRAVQAMIA
jgi:glutathione synthase/RimK-type ligase-like ATP-grasp enzyme